MPERCQREINALAPHRRVTASERAGGRGKKDEAAATRHDERRLCPLSQGAAFHLQKVILFKMIKSNGTFFAAYPISKDGAHGVRKTQPCTVGALTAFYPSSRPSKGRVEARGTADE